MNYKAMRQLMMYCTGLLLLAFGVTFSIKSNLGVSPVNSIPYVLSILTGVEQGLLTSIIFCCYIILQIFILRKKFKPIQFLQIIFSMIFGYFVMFSNGLWSFLPPETYMNRILLLTVSIIVIALGLLLYLTANIVPQPAEGLILAISDKTNIPFPKVKVLFDSTVVTIAALLSFGIAGELLGIREGTVIAALAIGKVLGILSKPLKPILTTFIEYKSDNIESSIDNAIK